MGSREILVRSIVKRLDADVGKLEICARKIGQLTDGIVSQALFRENYSLLHNIFQFNLSGDSASLGNWEEKHLSDVLINL